MPKNQFGVTRLLKQCFVHGTFVFGPRQRLIPKTTSMAETALNEKFLLPTLKLNGMLTFTETKTFGRIGKVVTRPLRQREHRDKPPWHTSHAIARALDMLLVFSKLSRNVSYASVVRATHRCSLHLTPVSIPVPRWLYILWWTPSLAQSGALLRVLAPRTWSVLVLLAMSLRKVPVPSLHVKRIWSQSPHWS